MLSWHCWSHYQTKIFQNAVVIWKRYTVMECRQVTYISPWQLVPLQWRHNGRDGVSDHQPRDCLLNRLFRRRKHQSSPSLEMVRGIHRWPVNSPHKGPVTRKMFLFDDVIMQCINRDHLLHGFSSPASYTRGKLFHWRKVAACAWDADPTFF